MALDINTFEIPSLTRHTLPELKDLKIKVEEALVRKRSGLVKDAVVVLTTEHKFKAVIPPTVFDRVQRLRDRLITAEQRYPMVYNLPKYMTLLEELEFMLGMDTGEI